MVTSPTGRPSSLHCGSPPATREEGSPEPADAKQKVLFRVFFHPHGDKVLLLLGGYHNAKHTSSTHQNAQIQLARKRLADWQARHRQRLGKAALTVHV